MNSELETIDFSRCIEHCVQRDRIHRNLHFSGDWSRLKWFRTRARWKQDRFQSINRHYYVSKRSMHRLQSDCISSVVALSKARSRETLNKRGTAEWEERWGSRRVRNRSDTIWRDGGREEGWELNKCLPAEICVPIFETPKFPRTAKWHHTFTALSSLSPFVCLTCGSIFLSLWHTHVRP